MKAPLTKRQRAVLDAIAAWDKEHGYAPTFREIATAIGVRSLGTVAKHIATLETNGYLVRGANSSYRNVRVVPEQAWTLKSCAEKHPICWFIGDCPACGMRSAA